MTEAMKAMLDAVLVELKRQNQELPGAPYVQDLDEEARKIADETSVDYDWGPQGVVLDGVFDLEALVRAALAAVEKPTIGLILAGAESPDSIGKLWPKLIRQGILDGPA